MDNFMFMVLTKKFFDTLWCHMMVRWSELKIKYLILNDLIIYRPRHISMDINLEMDSFNASEFIE